MRSSRWSGGGHFAREAAILTRSLAEAYLGRPRLVRETSRRYFGKSTTAVKVVLRLLFYPVVWLGRLPSHMIFMRHRMVDLKLWLFYGCIVAYYSICFILGEMYQSIKHQGKKVTLMVERRKLAKKTRRQLTREDAEFFRDVKKMRSDEYAKACGGRRTMTTSGGPSRHLGMRFVRRT